MAPITDLSWSQLNTALKQRLGTSENLIEVDAYGVPATIDIGAILQDIPMSEDGTGEALGVIKLLAILIDSCRDAQLTINVNQPTGEKLEAFPAPTTGAPVGTLVPITRTMITRADLSSATRILGRVA